MARADDRPQPVSGVEVGPAVFTLVHVCLCDHVSVPGAGHRPPEERMKDANHRAHRDLVLDCPGDSGDETRVTTSTAENAEINMMNTRRALRPRRFDVAGDSGSRSSNED